MVAIIDYGAGNLQSVKKALDFIGAENVITGDKNEIDAASHIILPGVGSFEDAMNCIREHDLENTIKKPLTAQSIFWEFASVFNFFFLPAKNLRV